MKGLSTEIDSKRFSIDEITQFLQTIPEYIDLMRLGGGKSFGEKALINNSLRAATVVCTRSCHFAVLNKLEYDKVLRKIELKNQNKLVSFLQQIPYLKLWTRRMLLNFSYFLNVRQFPVGHIIYKEGDECDEIAIVK
jgi:cAMP-dependent protein kinase regulator/cGMP-dependent protein kinase 2